MPPDLGSSGWLNPSCYAQHSVRPAAFPQSAAYAQSERRLSVAAGGRPGPTTLTCALSQVAAYVRGVATASTRRGQLSARRSTPHPCRPAPAPEEGPRDRRPRRDCRPRRDRSTRWAPGPGKGAGASAADGYTARHLSVLEGLEAVRKRPGMYIGSTDGRGLMHCLWEIFDNAVDEALGGHCTLIEVMLHPDLSAEVRDNGRGIPVDIEPKSGLTGVELVMTRLHAGGKFGGGSYTASGGLHGVGASVVNALAARLDVQVDRDGAEWAASFRRGVPGEFAADGPTAPLQPRHRAAQEAPGGPEGDRHPDQVLAGPPGVRQGRVVELRRAGAAGQADRLPGARPDHPGPRRAVRRRPDRPGQPGRGR